MTFYFFQKYRDAIDFDDNGVVDFADFLQFVEKFGTEEARFDLDNDGVVGFSDLLLFVSHFGQKDPRKAFNIDLVFVDELMVSGWISWDAQRPIGIITVQALADLGYTVDVTQADPFKLPVLSKRAITPLLQMRCGVGFVEDIRK